jgi:hypothetical protein
MREIERSEIIIIRIRDERIDTPNSAKEREVKKSDPGV